MDKPAVSTYELHDLIHRRWSPRSFDQRSVTDEQARTLLEAARWAPSCFNAQPWRYLVALRSDDDAFQAMLGCLAEANQSWAGNAGALMIAVARATFERNGKPNRHAWHDVGLATAHLTLQALSMGLYVHQMAGFSADKTREVYRVPDEFEPVAAIAIGYPGDLDSLSEGMRERELAPRSRKSLSEIAFAGAWDTPFAND